MKMHLIEIPAKSATEPARLDVLIEHGYEGRDILKEEGYRYDGNRRAWIKSYAIRDVASARAAIEELKRVYRAVPNIILCGREVVEDWITGKATPAWME